MFNIKLQTADGRTQVVVEPEQTPLGLLEEKDINIHDANVSLNGVSLSYNDMHTAFESLLQGEESATLSVVVKLENAGA